jgi:hypothetical protein
LVAVLAETTLDGERTHVRFLSLWMVLVNDGALENKNAVARFEGSDHVVLKIEGLLMVESINLKFPCNGVIGDENALEVVSYPSREIINKRVFFRRQGEGVLR